jgi:hypothetical protein
MHTAPDIHPSFILIQSDSSATTAANLRAWRTTHILEPRRFGRSAAETATFGMAAPTKPAT